MSARSFAAFFFLTTAVLPSGLCGASLRFVPMSILLDSEPRRGALTIINGGEEKATVQLQLMKWSQDGQGRDVYEPTKDLVFYPQIISIAPGKEGTIRVGDDRQIPLAREASYRLFVQELPMRKPGEKIVRIALRVGIPVFIAPRDPRPALSCGDTRIADGRLVVTFTNSGNVHSLIQKISLGGFDEAGREVFSRELGGWYVLPGVSRPFPIEVAPDECRAVKLMRIQGTAGDQIARGQFNVDDASCARLVESGMQEKLDVEKLLPPAKP
jgi:fimbrial chaperone protein